jgi:hypothetical protein
VATPPAGAPAAPRAPWSIAPAAATPAPSSSTSTPAFFEAINAIIRSELARRAHLRHRVVELRTNADGDLEVLYGAEILPEIDAIGDPEVREIVRGAIAKWQEQ